MSLRFDNAKPPQGECVSGVRAFHIHLVEGTIEYSICCHPKRHHVIRIMCTCRVGIQWTTDSSEEMSGVQPKLAENIEHCLVDHKRKGIQEPAYNLNSRPVIYCATFTAHKRRVCSINLRRKAYTAQDTSLQGVTN